MTDELGSLRQALSDLSEHGGATEMYERSVRRSRRLQRRTALATGAAVVVGVFGIGAAVVAATGNRPGPPAPPAAAPSSAGSGSACPPIGTLANLIELPGDWSIASTEVQCVETWAAVDVKRPADGNILYLFHYTDSTGWRYNNQGTEFACKDLGITGPAPFCT